MRRIVGSLAVLTLATQLGACGQPPPSFTPLFDGTLNGAVIENGGTFTVADGVLRADGPNGWLRFVEPARDFRLALELRFVSDYAASGVFLRSPPGITFARGWPNGNYEVELVNPASGNLTMVLGGVFRHGMPPGPAVIDEQAAVAAYTGANEWQLVQIEAIGSELTVQLNGVVVTRASDISDAPGYIGIQSETSGVEFRRIDIQRIERGAAAAAREDPPAPLAAVESAPSDQCYTAVPLRDQGNNDLPIEPVCRALEQNLNQFCDVPPLVCGLEIAPQFAADFTLPTWTPVDFGGSLDLIEATVRAQWQGTTPTAADLIWAEREPGLERALAEGRLSVSSAEIDLYQAGQASTFYRIDPGDCTINNGGVLRPDRPDYWDRRLVLNGARLLPTAESLGRLLDTFLMLSREEPTGDVLSFRGQVYTYQMWGNTYPASIDNRVLLNRGINYSMPNGRTLFFENVCEIKYRSPQPASE